MRKRLYAIARLPFSLYQVIIWNNEKLMELEKRTKAVELLIFGAAINSASHTAKNTEYEEGEA